MRRMTLVALLYVVLPCYGQEADAEKLFRAMEKKVRSAKTVHIVIDGQFGTENMQGSIKGEIHSADGEKSRMVMDILDLRGKSTKLLLVTDGKSIYTSVDNVVSVKDAKRKCQRCQTRQQNRRTKHRDPGAYRFDSGFFIY